MSGALQRVISVALRGGVAKRQFGTKSQIFAFSPNGDLTVEKFGVAVRERELAAMFPAFTFGFRAAETA